MTLPTSSTPKPSELEQLRREVTWLRQEVRFLREEREALLRKLFGRKSEKVSPAQLQLALELLEAGALPDDTPAEEVESDAGEVPLAPPPPRKKRTRRALPKDLPRERVVVDLPEEDKTCSCGTRREVIGEEISEKVDYVPASVKIRQEVRPKYACPTCHDGVRIAPAPPQAVEKSLATEGLLAHVVTSKYADHLPLHRQEGILARHGLAFSRSTLCGWVAAVAEATAPIVEQMQREIVGGDYIQTDDTPVTVLGGKDGSFKGRVWAYYDPLVRQVVYHATATHERAGPESFLADFEGFLQADAYTGYDALYRSGRIVEVACWAHARRRFRDALETEPQAATILELVQQLYGVERSAAELSAEERLALRQAQALPILAKIDEARTRLARDVLPKSPLGDALRYLGNQWPALQRYAADGRLVIDNNNAERALRAVAVGRKNWLFAGSLAAAERTATLYSLTQSCKLAGVDPFAYLRDIFIRLPTHPQSRIAELTPAAWAAARQATPAAVS